MTDEDRAELARLKQLLKTREKTPGWSENCAAIRKRIAEIENDAN